MRSGGRGMRTRTWRPRGYSTAGRPRRMTRRHWRRPNYRRGSLRTGADSAVAAAAVVARTALKVRKKNNEGYCVAMQVRKVHIQSKLSHGSGQLTSQWSTVT